MAVCGANSFDDDELVVLDSTEAIFKNSPKVGNGASIDVIAVEEGPSTTNRGNDMEYVDDNKYSEKDSIIKMNSDTLDNQCRQWNSLIKITSSCDELDVAPTESLITLEPESNLLVLLSYEEVCDLIHKVSSPPLRSPPILLYGAPGTGKTHIIEQAAVKVGKSIKFFSLSANDWRGTTEKDSLRLLENVFEKASSNAPSVVFLDDVDLMPSSASKLLTVNRNGVQILAATNIPHKMETNMLDAFMDKHHLSLPSIQTISTLFKAEIDNLSKYFNNKEFERAMESLGAADLSIREVKTLLEETLSSNNVTIKVFDEILEQIKSNFDKQYFMIMHNWSARCTD